MYTIPILAVLVFLGGMVAAYLMERKEWNRGACSCGKGWWKSFDMDSQGGRGYRCTDCSRVIWISYPFID